MQRLTTYSVISETRNRFVDNNRPPGKSAYWKTIFIYFSSKTYVVGTQKNRRNETVLLSTQNTCLN